MIHCGCIAISIYFMPAILELNLCSFSCFVLSGSIWLPARIRPMPVIRGRLFLAISSENDRVALRAGCAGPQPSLPGWWSCFWRWVGFLVGVVCFACSLRFAALFACLVCCFVLAFACLCPCWASLSCYYWHPVLARVWPAEGTTLPLGLGGLNNLFLLVGLGLFILSRNTVSNPFAV